MTRTSTKETEMTEKLKGNTLEIMCFRQGKKGLDVLLRKENTLQSYWHNFMSTDQSTDWSSKSATAYFQEATGISEKLREAGTLISDNGSAADLYFAFLTEVSHSTLALCPEQIMWVNGDVLLAKLVERPKKFKPELLEMLTTCLKHLRCKHAIAS
jgi:hypothetical protein